MGKALSVLVLGGGPDREREVSLHSAACVAAALHSAGHRVVESDIAPDNLAALDGDFDVVFPVLHGPWGEGGGVQRELESRNLRFVGCGSRAAATGMDKVACKRLAETHNVPTPPYQLVRRGEELSIDAPLVLKPTGEGSSLGVEICRTTGEVPEARARFHRQFEQGLAERFIDGPEVTVGVLDGVPLPVIRIVPAVAFYDYEAKYSRNDTRYEFETGLPVRVLDALRRDAVTMFKAVGCRHLSRVDFLIDGDSSHWFLEINTLPGFTDHSLFPKAAAKSGLDMPALCDRLVRLALRD